MSSTSLGVDQMILKKADLMRFLPDLNALRADKKGAIRSLAQRLAARRTSHGRKSTSSFSSLYGLDADAVQVVTDTLFAAASYRKAGKTALDRTTRDTRHGFVQTLA